MAVQASFFDGETAANHKVSVDVGATALRISGNSIHNATWSYSDLTVNQRVTPGTELRLSVRSDPGARLVIPAGSASQRICEKAPQLLGGFNLQRATRAAGWVAVTVLIVVGVLYGLLNLAPKTVAGMMPLEWREKLGIKTEKTVVRTAARCVNPTGQRALLRLAGKVASGTTMPPDFSIRVYDMKLMNAFAVAGGRVVLTRGLLKAAETPGEVAGVVAHELGHVANRHPEAALVRVLGIQLLISLATGGGGGDTLGNLAGLATLLSYTRDAEREADEFAQQVLTDAKIDTVGLIDFFKRVKKLQGKATKDSKINSLLSIISTHPGTEERIAKLKPLPKGVAIEVLTPLEWQALKNICEKIERGQKS